MMLLSRSARRRARLGGLGFVALFGMVSVGEASSAPVAPAIVATTAPVFVEASSGASTTFLETFDGQPTHPEPFNPRDWDIFQTSRDRVSWANPDPMDAHHAFANCGNVDAGGTHQITTWPETVFKCNDHVMTSIDGTP